MNAIFALGTSLMFLLPVIAGLWNMRSLRRSGTTPWPPGQSLVDTLARESGIRRSIAVLLHETVSSPMTFGVVHPPILLPVDAPSA